MAVRVLTLYMCKDRSHFKAENFASVAKQEGVEQEIFVVSAEPLDIEGLRSIVVPVRREWPLPIRVGYSVNAALKLLRIKYGLELKRFDYLFKVDSDVQLPRNYVAQSTSTRAPVAGEGAALLMSVPFFLTVLRGTYPMNHCDDGYIRAVSIAIGAWPPSPKGLRLLFIGYDKPREFAYGAEHYKWGLSPLLLALLPPIILRTKPRGGRWRWLKAYIVNVTGYVWAAMHRLDKYDFHKSYRKMRNRYFAKRFVKRFFGTFLAEMSDC